MENRSAFHDRKYRVQIELFFEAGENARLVEISVATKMARVLPDDFVSSFKMTQLLRIRRCIFRRN